MLCPQASSARWLGAASNSQAAGANENGKRKSRPGESGGKRLQRRTTPLAKTQSTVLAAILFCGARGLAAASDCACCTCCLAAATDWASKTLTEK